MEYIQTGEQLMAQLARPGQARPRLVFVCVQNKTVENKSVRRDREREGGRTGQSVRDDE